MTINDIIRKNNGYLETKDLLKNRRLYTELKQKVANGSLEHLRRGLYKDPNIAQLNHWQEVSMMYPQAVFHFLSAAAYYNLTTYMPHTHHLAIERKRKLVLADYPPVKLYYVSKNIFDQHITNDNGVRIYTIERTVCDIIRMEKYAGTDVVKEVCNTYLQSSTKNLETLMKTAKDIKCYDKVFQIFSILI